MPAQAARPDVPWEPAVRGLFFRAALEVLVAAGGVAAAAEVRRTLALPPLEDGATRPAGDFLRLVEATAARLPASLGGPAEALRHLGREAVRTFHGPVPEVASPLAGPPPRLTSASAFPAVRAMAPAGAWQVLPTGASSLLLQVLDEPLPPALLEGGLRAELERRGLQGEVTARPCSATECHYLVSWLDPRARSGRSAG